MPFGGQLGRFLRSVFTGAPGESTRSTAAGRLGRLVGQDTANRAAQQGRAQAQRTDASGRLSSVVAQDRAQMDEARDLGWTDRSESERLDKLLLGDEEARRARKSRMKHDLEEVREEPEIDSRFFNPAWIPMASSFVDSLYFRPALPTGISPAHVQAALGRAPTPEDFQSRLYVAFRKSKKTSATVQGYYLADESEYEAIFEAASKGETVHDFANYAKAALFQDRIRDSHRHPLGMAAQRLSRRQAITGFMVQ